MDIITVINTLKENCLPCYGGWFRATTEIASICEDNGMDIIDTIKKVVEYMESDPQLVGNIGMVLNFEADEIAGAFDFGNKDGYLPDVTEYGRWIWEVCRRHTETDGLCRENIRILSPYYSQES